ncbi:nucleoside recognition membrane protein YjiH [Pseudogracilibacillus auburnensis]|uniref:Nucleoside recognition membrane protein YjiH n=1 Tax=Pseudogracilibacillus auburnensis TaxID=1494959 RepID=A0A2V3W3B4_9BACI|nr:nucleoside recognition membrane protein YjiH [Pseudogracilibacillus auburnensis]
MQEGKSYTIGNYLKFIIPSLLGIFLLMIPISVNGEVTLVVAIWADFIDTFFGAAMPTVAGIIIGLSFFVALFTKWQQPYVILRSDTLRSLFDVGPIALFTRGLATIFVVMSLFHIGPEWIWSDATGGNILFGLLTTLVAIFFFAGYVLPLLLDFGLLEFFGTIMKKVMRPVFTLPGRSSIDSLVSWLGDGTIGVMLTNKQYEEGYYTKREAAVIGTTFSLVSIDFTIVILLELNLEHMFLPYYGTIIVAGLAAALIMPRIPPLSRKANTFYEKAEAHEEEVIPKNISLFKWGIHQAAERAKNMESFLPVVKGGSRNVLTMWFEVIPVVMAIGTVATIIAEYTPIFSWLGAPFIPLLNLLQIPEATEAAQTVVVGFADMFLPAILGSGIESEMTRFVIACLSVTQLIYMSEVGALLLGSKLPINMKDLIIIFILRTLITLPIIALIAHIIF